MTEGNLHHSVQQWQNGNKPACWRVCEWLWQRLSAETVRFVHALLDSKLEEHERMQRAENLASNTFWAAMLRTSGLPTPKEPVVIPVRSVEFSVVV